MSHKLLNYIFLLFWSIFGEIHRKIFFLDTKVTLSKTITEILRKFDFLTIFEIGQILRKIWICLNIFSIKPVKGVNINTNSFSPKKEPHTYKLGLCVVLKHFFEIHRELFFLDIKVTISETSTELLRKFVFLTIFERDKSWGKFGFV